MRISRFLIPVLVLLGLSCEERVVSPAGVAQVRLEPDAASIPVGKSEQFEARVMDGSGNALTGRPVNWAVADPAIAEIDGSGRVVGRAVGETRVIAAAEGAEGEALLRVTSNTVEGVEIDPADATVTFGSTRPLAATVRATDGTVLSDRVVSWSSDDPNIATVDAQGVVTGRGLGSTSVRASADGKSGSAAIRVEAPEIASIIIEPASVTLDIEETLQLAAVVRTAAGGTVAGLPLTWRSLDEGVATVSSTGLVTAVNPGQTRVTAEFGGRTGTVEVAVLVPPAATIEITPESITLLVNDTFRLNATARDQRGQVLDKTITWSARSASIASVDVTGLVRAVAPGVTWILASVDGVQDSARVEVSPRPVGSVIVRPGQATLEIGETQAFSALVLADDGSVLTRAVTWNSSNTGVATIDANGTATARAAGETTITATAGGVSGTATLTVTPPPVATVTVTPAEIELTIGGTQQLSATARDAGGNPITGIAVSWSSEDDAVASVSSTGLVTAEGPGSTEIRATIGGVSGTAAVTVAAPTAASIDISPSSLDLLEGATDELQAVVRDGSGNVISRPVSWSTRAAAVATVDDDGLVTAEGAGQTWIIATADGVSDSASVTVTGPVTSVARVEVDPATAILEVDLDDDDDASVRLRARAYDSRNRELKGLPVSWSSDRPLVAAVSSNGTVTPGVLVILGGEVVISATIEGVVGTSIITIALDDD